MNDLLCEHDSVHVYAYLVLSQRAFFARNNVCSVCRHAYRDAGDPGTALSSVHAKTPAVPLEARDVEDIMRTRNKQAGDATTETCIVSTSDGDHTHKRGAASAAAPEMSIQDRLAGQRPEAIKEWIEFRVGSRRFRGGEWCFCQTSC